MYVVVQLPSNDYQNPGDIHTTARLLVFPIEYSQLRAHSLNLKETVNTVLMNPLYILL